MGRLPPLSLIPKILRRRKMFKLRGPENCTSASHAGVIYNADEDGIFTVPQEAVSDFTRYHGFTTVPEKPEKVKTEKVKVEKTKPEKIEKLEKTDKLKKVEDITENQETIDDL